MTGAAINFVSRTLVGTTDLSPVSLKEEIAIFTPSDRAQSVLRAVKRGHIEVNDRWFSAIAKFGLCRVSDLEKLNRSFTSGEISDHLLEFFTPLLFPTSQVTATLGMQGDTIACWSALIMRAYSLTANSVNWLHNGTCVKTGIPTQGFLSEFISLIWVRFMEAMEVARYNFEIFPEWSATLHYQSQDWTRYSIPVQWWMTPSLTSEVTFREITLKWKKLAHSYETASIMMAEARALLAIRPLEEGHLVKLSNLAVEFYRLWETLPVSKRLELRSPKVIRAALASDDLSVWESPSNTSLKFRNFLPPMEGRSRPSHNGFARQSFMRGFWIAPVSADFWIKGYDGYQWLEGVVDEISSTLASFDEQKTNQNSSRTVATYKPQQPFKRTTHTCAVAPFDAVAEKRTRYGISTAGRALDRFLRQLESSMAPKANSDSETLD
jgi:hypothetical protein